VLAAYRSLVERAPSRSHAERGSARPRRRPRRLWAARARRAGIIGADASAPSAKARSKARSGATEARRAHARARRTIARRDSHPVATASSPLSQARSACSRLRGDRASDREDSPLSGRLDRAGVAATQGAATAGKADACAATPVKEPVAAAPSAPEVKPPPVVESPPPGPPPAPPRPRLNPHRVRRHHPT